MLKHIYHNNFGTDEPIVKRLMISVYDILHAIVGPNKIIGEKINTIYFNDIANQLLDCRRALDSINNHIRSLNLDLQYKYTPTYPELNRDVKTFLYTFKTVLKHQINLIKLFYANELNEINEARWDKVKSKLELLSDPLSIELVGFIKSNMIWIERVCQFRNDLEHTGNSLLINNISLNSNNYIVLMKWGGQHKPNPNKNDLYDMYIIPEDMNYLINKFILFSEGLFSICSNYKIIPDLNIMRVNTYETGLKLEPTDF